METITLRTPSPQNIAENVAKIVATSVVPSVATSVPHRPAREAWFAALAATALPLALYVWALAPGLPAGDSGELITVAATGGVAHPPGYPLFTMLAGLWLHVLPLGNAAWRLNLFSAVCTAAAAGVLALAVRRATGSALAGVLAAWSWALSTQAFRYALVAEVFPLNALLAACTLLAVVSAPAAGSVALAFLCALALAHHHTLLLLAAPAFAVSAWRALAPATTRAPRARRMALAALAGLAPLAWLPLAAHHTGALVWGEPSTLRGFLSLLTRAEYGSLRLDPAAAGLAADPRHLMLFIRTLPLSLGWVTTALCIVGAIALARRPGGRVAAIALAGFALAQAWFFTRIGFSTDVPALRGVVGRFYILPLLVLAFLAGSGMAWGMGLIARTRAVRLVRPVGASLLTALVLLPLATGRLAQVSQRGNDFTETLGQAVLASAPQGTVLFVRGDMLHNSLAYLTRVLHLRPNLIVIDQELLSDPWYVRQVRARWPGLLPPLGRAEHITLTDGRRVEGVAIVRPDSAVDLLEEHGQHTLPARDVVSIVPAEPLAMFRETRARFRRGPFLEQGEDRYSGLPGTRSLLWLDQLAGRRPVALMGPKDESWTLGYELVSMGYVTLAYPRGSVPAGAVQLEAMLAAADSTDPGIYFGEYAEDSLERTELWRFPAFVARSALLLCQPDAPAVVARHPVAHARVLEFARRFEPLVPSPDPECLAAIGYLRWVDESFRDPALALRDLERALAERPALADGMRARRALVALRDSLR